MSLGELKMGKLYFVKNLTKSRALSSRYVSQRNDIHYCHYAALIIQLKGICSIQITGTHCVEIYKLAFATNMVKMIGCWLNAVVRLTQNENKLWLSICFREVF